MNEEMMDEHYVQPTWKISDASSAEQPSTTTDNSAAKATPSRANWGVRESVAVKPPAGSAEKDGGGVSDGAY